MGTQNRLNETVPHDHPKYMLKLMGKNKIIEPRHEISNTVVCAQSDHCLCLSLEYSLTVKLLTEHHLEFLILNGASQARLSLNLSKCHIDGNHMSRLILRVK